jgi:ABC-type phosphate/phosphonate transport system substrate-binding protein
MRAAGMTAPDSLTRGPDAYWPAWGAPDLVLSQSCGFPYRAKLHGKVTLIGTPDFGVQGCAPGYYRSVFVAGKSDPRRDVMQFDGASLAFNEDLSQSGWAAPQNFARIHGLSLRPTLRTGGHLLSARAVAEGRAEIAALDAITWEMIQRHEPFAAHLQVVGVTNPTPGLPYIGALGVDAGVMFDVIAAAIAALPDADKTALCLRGLVKIDAQTYLAVPTPPTPFDLGMVAEG